MDLKELTKIKDQGNELFKSRKYEEAIAQFDKCITSMEKQ